MVERRRYWVHIAMLLSSGFLVGRRSLMTCAMRSTSSSSSNNKVAILGSGIAGATAARKIAENGVSVTVFEAGFGAGGRTSTRMTRGPDSPTPPLQFDHGAQYISEPKSKAFGEAIKSWMKAGIVQNWEGSFVSISKDGISAIDESKHHYVGVPTMNSIAKYLLDHERITVVFQTRACCSFDASKNKWSLTRHDDDSPDASLGDFDWVVAGDRLSATNNRADLRHAPVDRFKETVQGIESIPILVLMVSFEEKLDVPFDGALFEGQEFGSLGWIARDSSKPTRARDDGQDCWVIQSNADAAREVLSQVDGETFEEKRENVRARSKELLMNDFLAALPKLSENRDSFKFPQITYAVGHRWSASFPDVSPSDSYCFLDNLEHNFLACGDFLGPYPGRIEGAFLSGTSAADRILRSMENSDDS